MPRLAARHCRGGHCPSMQDPKRGYSKLYVCNYGPGGNLVGGSLYQVGVAAGGAGLG